MTTRTKRERNTHPAYFAYMGTVLLVILCMVGVGLGGHVYRWEVFTWGGTTLTWVYAWSRQVHAAEAWRKTAEITQAGIEAWYEIATGKDPSCITVIPGKAEKPEGE